MAQYADTSDASFVMGSSNYIAIIKPNGGNHCPRDKPFILSASGDVTYNW